MVSEILVNTGSCNGLLPDGTKPLPDPMLTYHLISFCDIYPKIAILQETLVRSFDKMSLKITLSKLLSYLQEDNALKIKPPILFKIKSSILLTHCGRETQYGDGSMLCKNRIFFIMKEFPQI